jgi:hypothetical protein
VALSHERCTTARKPVATAFRFSESTQHSFAATAQPKTAPLIDDANEQLTDITGLTVDFDGDLQHLLRAKDRRRAELLALRPY